MAPRKSSSTTNVGATVSDTISAGVNAPTSRVSKPRACKAVRAQALAKSLVKKHRDGFLNLELPTQSPLAAISGTNSTSSPLLRLPSEIRHMIWTFAVGGNCIAITKGLPSSGSKSLMHASKPMGYGTHGQPPMPSTYLPPALSLPLVCRHTYLETSLLIYKLNKFTFPNFYVYEAMDIWIRNRTRAQKNAVAMVEPSSRFWSFATSGLRQPLSTKFPNLKYIDISSCASGFNRDNLFILNAIKTGFVNREGAGVEIGWVPLNARQYQDFQRFMRQILAFTGLTQVNIILSCAMRAIMTGYQDLIRKAQPESYHLDYHLTF